MTEHTTLPKARALRAAEHRSLRAMRDGALLLHTTGATFEHHSLVGARKAGWRGRPPAERTLKGLLQTPYVERLDATKHHDITSTYYRISPAGRAYLAENPWRPAPRGRPRSKTDSEAR